MNKKLLVSAIVSIMVAATPGIVAMAGSEVAAKKAEQKVTREELKQTISNITNRLEKIEVEQKQQREEAAKAQAQQFELLKMLIQKVNSPK